MNFENLGPIRAGAWNLSIVQKFWPQSKQLWNINTSWCNQYKALWSKRIYKHEFKLFDTKNESVFMKFKKFVVFFGNYKFFIRIWRVKKSTPKKQNKKHEIFVSKNQSILKSFERIIFERFMNLLAHDLYRN